MWTEEKVEQLIELFKNYPILWDTKHKDYRNRSKKMEAMREISQAMEIEVVEIERKLGILLTQFRRTHKKVLNLRRVGLTEDDAERNIWYGYKALDFLADRFDASLAANISKVEVQEETEALFDPLGDSSQEEYVLMKDSNNRTVIKDEYDLYGEQIALKLKKMDAITRAETQHHINCILHQVEMKVLQGKGEPKRIKISLS